MDKIMQQMSSVSPWTFSKSDAMISQSSGSNKPEFQSIFEKRKLPMFKIITNEQTPKVPDMEDPAKWISENKDLIQDFLEFSKNETRAVGLAANQLSKNGERFMERVFCSRAKGEGTGQWKVYVNPKIVKKHGDALSRVEGCLTWPGKKVLAKRYLRIDVEWCNLDGNQESAELSGWEAQVWQHEQEHLEGIQEEVVSADHFTIRSEKIGRNDPCPCGKTDANEKVLKYKKCCGK